MPLLWYLAVGLAFYPSLEATPSNQCGQPEVPENGHVIFHNSGSLVTGVTVSYKCDVGFILVGPEQRVCESSGAWSEHAPVCAINVALYKPATQSSTLYTNFVGHYANFSTDGNFDGVCSSTKAVNDETDAMGNKKSSRTAVNWWRVDLLEAYRIYAVELLIPAPTSSSTFENRYSEDMQIDIFASLYNPDEEDAANEASTVCYKHKGRLETNQLHTFVCQKELNARYIRIISKTVAPLQLCEVVVLSTAATSDWQCGSISNMDSWGAFDGKCFYGSNEPMPWYSASTHCQMNGASLVSETSEGLHKYLSAQARSRGPKHVQNYWLGLVMGGNREWTWIGGKPAEIGFWSNTKSREVTVTSMAYAAAMAQTSGWNWVPALQSLWYNWICQSKPRFCSGPGIPQNGGVMLSSQMYTIGASAYYYCNYGFVLKGLESRICLENGTWSGRAPKCIVVDCGKLDAPVGMTIKYINDSTLAGSKIEFRCPAGQKIVGTESKLCQADGTWSDASPKCVDVDCGWPPEVANGRIYVSDNSTKVGSVSELACDSGFGLIGPPIRHCALSGQWIPSQTPYCYDINTVHGPLQQANGESWRNSSLMTGFVVAVVVLLVIVLIVLIWTWRKRKAYDGLSMTTLYAAVSSQFAAAASAARSSSPSTHIPEVLYAFPNSGTPTTSHRTHSPNTDGASNYYAPSLLNTSNESNGSSSNQRNQRKLSFLSADDLHLDSNHKTFQPFVMAKGVPIPIAPPLVLSSAAGIDNPIFLAPIHHDPKKMEKIINDIHLTVPNRRFGKKFMAMEAKRQSPEPMASYHRSPVLSPKPHSGAKTMGAAAGRTLNSVISKVRRKLTESNFLLSGNADKDDRISNQQSDVESKSNGPSPTLRISLADIVQQLNDVKSNQSLITDKQLVTDNDRSVSPTASELFAFDDDDNDCVYDRKDSLSQRDHSQNRLSVHLGTFAPRRNERDDSTISGNEDESKIYDLPPDASALIFGNLAKVLIRQSQLANENIYEIPSDAETSPELPDKAETSQKLEQVGIEIVHTYC